MPDWIETKTAELLTRAKRSQFFRDIIADAQWIEETEAKVWDVALAESVRYWCSALPVYSH